MNKIIRSLHLPSPLFGIAKWIAVAVISLNWILGTFYVTQAVAQAQLDAIETAANAGTAAVIEIYSGSVPADADASIGAAVLLASLTCNASIFTSKTDANPGALGTFAAITNDSSADATGTAAFFRIKTQTGGTVICQGTVGTSGANINFNTVAFTAGSTISITSMTWTVPES